MPLALEVSVNQNGCAVACRMNTTTHFSFRRAESARGVKATVEPARKGGKPVLHLCKANGVSVAERALRHFIAEHGITVLNVAGPGAWKEPEVGALVREVPDRRWPSQ